MDAVPPASDGHGSDEEATRNRRPQPGPVGPVQPDSPGLLRVPLQGEESPPVPAGPSGHGGCGFCPIRPVGSDQSRLYGLCHRLYHPFPSAAPEAQHRIFRGHAPGGGSGAVGRHCAVPVLSGHKGLGELLQHYSDRSHRALFRHLFHGSLSGLPVHEQKQRRLPSCG